MKFKTVAIVILFFIIPVLSHSQVLPHKMTEDEKQKYPEYLQNIISKGETTPPEGTVRTAAEWEEMQGIVISWQGYTDILTEIVRYGVHEGEVFIVTENPGNVQAHLQEEGIELTNIDFVNAPSNTVWIRDYGPNNIYFDTTGKLAFVDWIYNRPRPSDDTIPSYLARQMNVELYETTQPPLDLVQPGGNFMSDGFGTGFSSKLMLEENPNHTAQEIDNIMKVFMGIERYIKMETLPYDGIHHIDMHMKLLDEETLLVGRYPEGTADGPKIEENLDYILDNYQSVFGTPYRVIRIPMPADNGSYPDDGGDYLTYTNSLIFNKTILVPIYGIDTDTTALNIYRKAMPGYKVVGIDSREIIPANGAIHCITHEIAAENPLLISHQRLRDDMLAGKDTVRAKIYHNSGISGSKIFFRYDKSGSYKSEPMKKSKQNPDVWEYVFEDTTDKQIYYYIEAEANSGKIQVRPMPAPEGYWSYHNMSVFLTAKAGGDQWVFMNDTVYLDGSNSYSPTGEPFNYSWSAPQGIDLSDSTSEKPFFVAPAGMEGDSLVFCLQVMTDSDTSHTDSVKIYFKENIIPLADAGIDKNVTKGARVVLNGEGSYDENGQSLSYHWESLDGVNLGQAGKKEVWFYYPWQENAKEHYRFVLRVNDGIDDSEPDTVTVHRKEAKTLPFSEDFEEITELPADYRTMNVDQRNPAGGSMESVFKNKAWSFVNMSSMDSRFIAALSWYEPEGDADDWLILPAVQLTENTQLSWDALSFTTSGNYPDDYEVYVSNTVQDTSGFYTNERVYYVDDESWREDASIPGDGMAQHSINLAEFGFSEEQVYVAFRLMTPDPGGYMLGIDNFRFELLNRLTFQVKNEEGEELENIAVYIENDSLVTNQDGETAKLLVNGSYEYLVVHDDYKGVSGEIELNNSDTTLNITLEENTNATSTFALRNNEVKVFPNPAETFFYIEYRNNQPGKLEIFDMQGRKIKVRSLFNTRNKINISNMEPGVYLLKIQKETDFDILRFIKK